MSAILFAARPDIRTAVSVPLVRNIDIAPTIMQILGVPPAATVDGMPLVDVLVP
jgi:arylsulfatase A-like enzyme